MPSQRDAEKFKLAGCWVDRDFLTEIDRVRGEQARSQFLRDALQEKLKT